MDSALKSSTTISSGSGKPQNRRTTPAFGGSKQEPSGFPNHRAHHAHSAGLTEARRDWWNLPRPGPNATDALCLGPQTAYLIFHVGISRQRTISCASSGSAKRSVVPHGVVILTRGVRAESAFKFVGESKVVDEFFTALCLPPSKVRRPRRYQPCFAIQSNQEETPK